MLKGFVVIASFLILQQVHAAVWRVDVTWNAIYPVSSYIQPGDIISFYATDCTQSHWVVQVFQNFSGQNFSGEINSGPYFANCNGPAFEYNVTITDDQNNGLPWADLFNPDTAGFGVAYIARPTDVSITWTVFQTHPPALSNYSLDPKYPYDITIQTGQRVVWDSSEEPLLNHITLFANLQWQASIGCPFVHPWVSNRNFHHFVYWFPQVGSYRYICGVHTSMRGTVKVCPSNLNSCLGGDIPRVCSD